MSNENIELTEALKHFCDDIPLEIYQYAKNEVLGDSRYIFVNEGKHPEAFCTHCKQWYFEQAPLVKFGSVGTCPNCKSRCIYKHAWRSRTKLFTQAYFLYFEKSVCDEDVVTATWYYVINDLRNDYTKETFEIMAVSRMMFDCKNNSSCMLERWPWNKKWVHVGKIVTPATIRNNNIRRRVAAKSIKSAVAGTRLAYSEWGYYALEDIGKYFALALKYPSVEILTKAGLADVVKTKLYGYRTYGAIDWRACKLHNIFKVSKQDYLRLTASGAELLHFWLWQQARKEKSKLRIADFIKISGKTSLEGYLTEFKILRKYTTMHRIFNYVEKQFNHAKDHYRSQGYVLTTWRDYIQDCLKLELDLSDDAVLFPRDLEATHQETMKRIKYVEHQKMREQALKRKQELEKYEFQEGEFLIRVPVTTKEIVAEGNKLSHCVGGYAERHIRGETTILFLRSVKNPDEPFYTIELNKKLQIVQVRGKKNAPETEPVQQFMEKFKELLQKQKNEKKARKRA